MKSLRYTVSHHLSKLHDELLAAVPSLQPVTNADGEREAVMRISGDGETLTLVVPDDAPDADIQAVLDAHDPTPPPLPPDPDEELVQAIQDAATLDDLKKALVGKLQAGQRGAVKGRPV